MSFHAQDLARLPEAEREAFVAGLTQREAEALKYEWSFWARPEQRLPAGDWVNWLILAGRGTGKTRVGSETVREWVKRYRYVNLIGATVDDVRDVMVLGESGILAVCPKDERPRYIANRRLLDWPNGAKSLIFSAEEPDRFRGKQHEKLWLDELAAWRYGQDAWDQASLGLRLGDRPQAIITTTPRPIKIIKDLVADSSTRITRGSTYDNIANLADTFISTIVKRYEGTRLGRQELNADILDDIAGAMWTREMIDRAVAPTPKVEYRRVVVALDPAVTSGENSDEFGIIVAALGADGHGYVLDDATGRYSVQEWPKKAIGLYRKYKADRIVAEVNNGGDMIEATIRTVDATVSYSSVHATRGKVMRAEPVAALYEKGLVHHVGSFAKLEDEMAGFTHDYDRSRDGSPNRVDALVWGLTELKIDPTGATGMLDFYRAEVAAAESGKPVAVAEPEGNAPAQPVVAPQPPALVTLICPRGTGVVCGLSRREYAPDDLGMIRVEPEDAPPLKRAGFMEVHVAAS